MRTGLSNLISKQQQGSAGSRRGDTEGIRE